jgi:hypothetical protein
MADDATNTEIVKTKLPNGTIIRVQATLLESEIGPSGARAKVANPLSPATFDNVTGAIEGIAETVVSTLQKVKPRSASVEFGLEIAVESGGLTALLVKGTGTANLKITLEWGEAGSDN